MNIHEYRIHFIHSSRIIHQIRIFKYSQSIRKCYIINIRRGDEYSYSRIYICVTLYVRATCTAIWSKSFVAKGITTPIAETRFRTSIRILATASIVNWGRGGWTSELSVALLFRLTLGLWEGAGGGVYVYETWGLLVGTCRMGGRSPFSVVFLAAGLAVDLGLAQTPSKVKLKNKQSSQY
jgi:hypothetical protein